MNLKEQMYILTVAECKSITRAAEKLHVSQPALSSFVRSVEEALGVKLFERSSKGLMPTYAGELYLRAARRMFFLKSEFDENLSGLKNDRRGRLRIGMQMRRSPYIIPEFYKEFGEKYPEVEISFAEGVMEKLEKMLHEDELDLVLCDKIRELPGFTCIKITEEFLLLAVSPNHALAGSGKWLPVYGRNWIDLRRFGDETFILQGPWQSQRIFSDWLLRSMKITPSRIIEIQNIETSTRMSALGIGVSFVKDTYARHFSFAPEPCYFLVGETPFTIEFVAIHKEEKYMPSFVGDAIDIIRKGM